MPKGPEGGMPCDEGMEEPCYDLLGQPTIGEPCAPSRKEPWHVGPPPPPEEPTAPEGKQHLRTGQGFEPRTAIIMSITFVFTQLICPIVQ